MSQLNNLAHEPNLGSISQHFTTDNLLCAGKISLAACAIAAGGYGCVKLVRHLTGYGSKTNYKHEHEQKQKSNMTIIWKSFISDNIKDPYHNECISGDDSDQHSSDRSDISHKPTPRYWIPHLFTETGHEIPLLYVPEGCDLS